MQADFARAYPGWDTIRQPRAWLYKVALRELFRAEARVRMSLRSMKLIGRRCEAPSAVPGPVECLFGDLPASDDEGLIDQDLFAELGIEDLVAELARPQPAVCSAARSPRFAGATGGPLQ
jgi:hypothetical protein